MHSQLLVAMQPSNEKISNMSAYEKRQNHRWYGRDVLLPFFSSSLSYLIAPSAKEKSRTSQCIVPLPLYDHRQSGTLSPVLSVDLWPRVLSHIKCVGDLGNAALVSKSWNSELTSRHAEPIWRSVWDANAGMPAKILAEKTPWALVRGALREQVAASHHLRRIPKLLQESACSEQHDGTPLILCLPPRFARNGRNYNDVFRTRPGRIDVEESLGSAIAAEVFASGLFVVFERGVGVLVNPTESLATKLGRSNPQEPLDLFYDNSPLVMGIQLLAERPVGPEGFVVAATAAKNIIRFAIQLERASTGTPRSVGRLLDWKVIDTFDHIPGSITELAVSVDDEYVAVGLSTGHVRKVNIRNGTCEREYSMCHSAQHIAANKQWIVATNSFLPIGGAVWNATRNEIHQTLDRTTEGWKDITTLAGVVATQWQDLFAVWNGCDTVRLLDARTGTFTWICHLQSNIKRTTQWKRSVWHENPLSVQLGRGKIVISADRTTVFVAASNRVFRVDLCRTRPSDSFKLENPQIIARYSVLALSTDELVLITAEGSSLGKLESQVTSFSAHSEHHALHIWTKFRRRIGDGNSRNPRDPCYHGSIPLPSSAKSVSSCGDTIAAVCSNGQVVVAFARPTKKVMQTLTVR